MTDVFQRGEITGVLSLTATHTAHIPWYGSWDRMNKSKFLEVSFNLPGSGLRPFVDADKNISLVDAPQFAAGLFFCKPFGMP